MNCSVSRRKFILDNTSVTAPPHVPEIRLYLADEVHDLWHKTEEELEAIGVPPPFWAFAWAGGQGLARYILDQPEVVSGKRVLDFGAGSGLVAIAAGMAGAHQVLAVDIDPFCEAAITLNSALNEVEVGHSSRDLLALRPEEYASELSDHHCILAGDVFYDHQMAAGVWPLLQAAARTGTDVLVGDPGRSYLPTEGLRQLAEFQVPVIRVLEDNAVKRTTVWQVAI